MKKNKIMFVTPYFYPSNGGLENYALNIIEGLKKKGNWEIIVVTSNGDKNKNKKEIINGVRIYRLSTILKISNAPVNLKWYFDIKKIIKEEKPDLINAHAPVPFIADVAAQASGKSLFVLTYHTGSMKKNNFLTDLLVLMYEKYFIKLTISKASYVICSSSFVRDFLIGQKVLGKKSVVINPGVNPENLKNNKKPGFNVLFVGALGKTEKHKGLDYLLSSIIKVKESVPKVKLFVVGGGNAVSDYKKKTIKLGLGNYVSFKGELDKEKLSIVYNNSDLLVLPSINESFGTVLIEAMEKKLPVIGANTGGIPEIIDDNVNGFIVSPKNSSELAEKIIKILKDKKLAKRLGEQGYKKVREKYLWQYQIDKTDQLFRKVLNER